MTIAQRCRRDLESWEGRIITNERGPGRSSTLREGAAAPTEGKGQEVNEGFCEGAGSYAPDEEAQCGKVSGWRTTEGSGVLQEKGSPQKEDSFPQKWCQKERILSPEGDLKQQQGANLSWRSQEATLVSSRVSSSERDPLLSKDHRASDFGNCHSHTLCKNWTRNTTPEIGLQILITGRVQPPEHCRRHLSICWWDY